MRFMQRYLIVLFILLYATACAPTAHSELLSDNTAVPPQPEDLAAIPASDADPDLIRQLRDAIPPFTAPFSSLPPLPMIGWITMI